MGDPVKIDKESIDFIVGSLTQELKTIEQTIQKQNGAVFEIQKTLKGLPCNDHSRRIETLQKEWVSFFKWDTKKKAAVFTFVLTLIAVFIKILLLKGG